MEKKIITFIIIFFAILITQISVIGFAHTAQKQNATKVLSLHQGSSTPTTLYSNDSYLLTTAPLTENPQKLFAAFGSSDSEYSTKYTFAIFDSLSSKIEKIKEFDLSTVGYPVTPINSSLNSPTGSTPYFFNHKTNEVYAIVHWYVRFNPHDPNVPKSPESKFKSAIYQISLDKNQVKLLATSTLNFNFATFDLNTNQIIIAATRDDNTATEYFLKYDLSSNTIQGIAQYNKMDNTSVNFSDIRYIPSSNKIYQLMQVQHNVPTDFITVDKKYSQLLSLDLTRNFLESKQLPSENEVYFYPSGIRDDGLAIAYFKGSKKSTLMIYNLENEKNESSDTFGEIADYTIHWSSDNQNVLVRYKDVSKIYNIQTKAFTPLVIGEILKWSNSQDKILFKDTEGKLQLYDTSAKKSFKIPFNNSKFPQTLTWF